MAPRDRGFAPLASALAVAAALLTGGCGGDDPPVRPPVASAGAFPERPQVADDFADSASGWPRAGYRDGAYVLADSEAAGVLAPPAIQPPTRGTLAEVMVVPPRGGAGLLCRAAADGATGYALLLGDDGRLQLSRLEDGRTSVLDERRIPAGERAAPGTAARLRLGCGTGAPGAPITLVYAAGDAPYTTLRDDDAVDPGPYAHAGLVTRDGTARFDDFALFLGE